MNKKNTVGSRLEAIRKHFRVGLEEYLALIDLTESSFKNLMRSGKNTSYKVLKTLKENYPTLDINWLITGEGNMLLDIKKNENSPFDETMIGYNIGDLDSCKALLKEKERVIQDKDKVIERLEEDKKFLKSLVSKR